MPSRLMSPFLIALAAMLWGSDLLLRPNALSAGWSPAWLVLGEHVILTLLFLPVLWRERQKLSALDEKQWGALLFVAWGGSALATWLYTKAFTLDFSQALTVVLLQKTQPIVALLLAGLLLGERRKPTFWVWCLAAFAGAYLLIGFQKTPSISDIHFQQALLALGASALWGAATVAGRSLTSALTPSGLAGARFALAVPVLLGLTLVPTGVPSAPTHSIHYAALFLLLIVLLPDLAGMVLYYVGLRGTPASVATLAELCYPLTALAIGVFVQHTPMLPGQWIGVVLLVAAVVGLGQKPGVAAPIVQKTSSINVGTGMIEES
ncbi:MAG: DMT family transporter [Janthinobacterium lividum]